MKKKKLDHHHPNQPFTDAMHKLTEKYLNTEWTIQHEQYLRELARIRNCADDCRQRIIDTQKPF